MFDPYSGSDPAPTHFERPAPVNEAKASTLRSSIRLPATARQITRARQFLERFVAGSPVADDAVLCLSEVATNSVLHSNSRRDGGRFTVSAERYDDGCVRVEVQDQGGPWIQRPKPEGQLSLGLEIVSQLAGEWGIKDVSDSARTVWFQVGAVRSPAQAAA